MSTLTTINATDQITDSRAVINTNFSNLNNDKIETSVIDTDTTLAANSDAKIPSQKAVKAYVDGVGTVNASTTAKGVVEEATDAQVSAGTDTGETGARLFVPPSKILTATSKITFGGLTDTDANFTSATETALLTATLPGGSLSTNKIVKGRIYLTSVTVTDQTITLTVRLKYGSTTICSFILDASNSISANTYNGYIDFVLMADGSVSAQTGLLHFFLSEKTLDPLNATNGANHIVTGTATETSSSDLTLQVTGQWSVGNNNTINSAIAWMEITR